MAQTATPASQNTATAKIPLYLPLLYSVPAFFPLVWTALRAWRSGLIPTPFIQYDLPYYGANGRQSFVQGFHLTYGNPYARYGTPAIYFQPHILFLGFLQRIGLSPDLALIIFQLAAVAFAAIVAAKLFQEWVGWNTSAQKLAFVCFFWGGGVLSLSGAVYGLLAHMPPMRAFVLFDVGDGWWMFNFGRNLVYATEAYYHGLFLLSILLLVRKHFIGALALAALLSASHPFTGLSLALILLFYCALELLLKSGAASLPLLLGTGAIITLHLAYYAWFLNRYADHRALQAQWKLDWPYPAWTFVLALYLVGIFAFAPLTRWINLKAALSHPRSRLCLVWFAAIFGLTHHDLVIPPRQPIHFARGYDWIALFLLGAPALVVVLQKLLTIRARVALVVAVSGFMALFLSDNLLWFATFTDPSVQWQALALTHDQKDVLDWLSQHASAPAYVASSDQRINYLTPAFTSVRAWRGHDFNTPDVSSRQSELQNAFSANQPIPTTNPVYYVPRRDQNWTPPAGAARMFSNGSYDVWLLQKPK